MQLVTSHIEDARLEVAGSGKFRAISGSGIPESLPACGCKWFRANSAVRTWFLYSFVVSKAVPVFSDDHHIWPRFSSDAAWILKPGSDRFLAVTGFFGWSTDTGQPSTPSTLSGNYWRIRADCRRRTINLLLVVNRSLHCVVTSNIATNQRKICMLSTTKQLHDTSENSNVLTTFTNRRRSPGNQIS